MPGRERTIIQGVAEETRVFHIRITLFIFNIKKVLITQKEGILMQFKSTYQITYGKCQSDDVLLAGHTFGAFPQSPALHAPKFFAAQLNGEGQVVSSS